MGKKKAEKRGVKKGRPNLRKPKRKILYPKKTKNITRRQARAAVKKVSASALRKKHLRFKHKGVKQIKPRLKRKKTSKFIAETVMHGKKPTASGMVLCSKLFCYDIYVREDIKGAQRRTAIAFEKEHIREAQGKTYKEMHPRPYKPAKISRSIVAKTIRESARVKTEYVRNEKTCYRETKLKVTQEFIDEYVDRMLVGIEKNVPLICEQVLAKGRKTLMVKEGNGINDVISFFDLGKNTLAENDAPNMPKPLIDKIYPAFKKLEGLEGEHETDAEKQAKKKQL